MPMPLSQLLPEAHSSVLIRELTLDSRKVLPGDLFLAVPGLKGDGREHIAEAFALGAGAVAYEPSEDLQVSAAGDQILIAIDNLSEQLSAIAGRFYGEPSRSLTVIGVTGTNGKTSVTHLLAQALDKLGHTCGLIGTLGTGFYGKLAKGVHTTPDPIGVQAALAGLKRKGADCVAMEVSSHGLQQGRVTALDFDIAVFTNLTRGHLDYHGTFEAYAAAKAKLFAMPSLKTRVLNLDDSMGRQLAEADGPGNVLTYSMQDPSATLYCEVSSVHDEGILARVVTAQGEHKLRSPLLGQFNLSNLLATIGTLLAMGYPLDEVLAIVPELKGPEGRMQRLGGQNAPLVVVDYAHTPDALEQVLLALRPHTQGQLRCVFGCGGDRDRGKRALMAQVAEKLADDVWVTDDNPRFEEPEAIREEIMGGFAQPEAIKNIAGRGEAIRQAIAASSVGDIVLLAGKGHEDYQEIAGVREHFSDLELAAETLQMWGEQHV